MPARKDVEDLFPEAIPSAEEAIERLKNSPKTPFVDSLEKLAEDTAVDTREITFCRPGCGCPASRGRI